MDFRTEHKYDSLNVYHTRMNEGLNNGIWGLSGTKIHGRGITEKFIKDASGKVVKYLVSDYHRFALDFESDCLVNYRGFLIRYSLLGIIIIIERIDVL